MILTSRIVSHPCTFSAVTTSRVSSTINSRVGKSLELTKPIAADHEYSEVFIKCHRAWKTRESKASGVVFDLISKHKERKQSL
jgi:hypothetical protein